MHTLSDPDAALTTSAPFVITLALPFDKVTVVLAPAAVVTDMTEFVLLPPEMAAPPPRTVADAPKVPLMLNLTQAPLSSTVVRKPEFTVRLAPDDTAH